MIPNPLFTGDTVNPYQWVSLYNNYQADCERAFIVEVVFTHSLVECLAEQRLLQGRAAKAHGDAFVQH